jgi:hypothetical protein
MMEALELKWHILKLSRYQLRMGIPVSHSPVVPELVMVLASICSLTDPNQEIYQNCHHSLPILGDGSTCTEVAPVL